MCIEEKSTLDTKIIKGRVSVLVPCYNGERFIKRCLNSVLSQTWKDIELIIVNDGSTDDTDQVIQSYYSVIENKLSKFIYIKQDNMGVGAAMNTALKYFSGEFLAPFDCDDYMMPDSLEIRATWLIEHPETAVVQNNGYYVTEDDFNNITQKFSSVTIVQENIQLFEQLINGQTYNWPGSYMIRSSIWLKRCPNREIFASRSGQNMQLLLPATYNNKCDYIPMCLLKYGVHIGSLSNATQKNEEQQIADVLGYQDIYQTVLRSFLPDNKYNKYKEKIEITFTRRIMDIKLSHKNKSDAKQYYKKLKAFGSCSLDDKIRYYKVMNGVMFCLLRICQKAKSLRRFLRTPCK